MIPTNPLYKGGVGEIASWLHKLTGLGVFFFLVFHIFDTAALAYSSELYNKVIAIYRNPLFKIGEVGLIGCVLFHAFNGVRLILLDLFTFLIKHHKTLFWVQTAIVFLLWIPTGLIILIGR